VLLKPKAILFVKVFPKQSLYIFMRKKRKMEKEGSVVKKSGATTIVVISIF
jgi:hypothetical protein